MSILDNSNLGCLGVAMVNCLSGTGMVWFRLGGEEKREWRKQYRV